MSREQTVAMETVVSDAVGKATPTSVEERTKLNILRGSHSTQAINATHIYTHTHAHTHVGQDSGRQIKGFSTDIYFSL